MVSRIYKVTDRDLSTVARWVRAQTKNGAMRAVAGELFDVAAASTDEVYAAMRRGAQILDAVDGVPAQALVADGTPS